MTRTGFEEWAGPEREGGAEAGRITRADFGSGRVQSAWAGLWRTVGVAKR